MTDDYKIASMLSEVADTEVKELKIEQLKRNIKYCKNPMELKISNQLLNQKYKERKKCNGDSKEE